MKEQDGGPIKTFGWQLAKAIVAALVVVIYSRGMGAYGRGALSILLLNLQLVLMVSELVAGGALANLLTKFPMRRILPTAWLFLIATLAVGYLFGWFVWVVPNAGDFPLGLDHPKVVALNLLFFQGLFLGGLNIQYNIFQAHGWVMKRNRLQVSMEVLKLVGLLLCLESIYGFLFPRIWAVKEKMQSADLLWNGQTTLYVNGFDELAVLWVLVYASGLVWLFSLWQSRELFRRNVLGDGLEKNDEISLGLESEDSNRPHNLTVSGMQKSSFLRTLQPPKELYRSGILSQIGHIILFLLYRLPLWWMAAQYGNRTAGLLANALLIADTIWIFGNSFGTILHSRILVGSTSYVAEPSCAGVPQLVKMQGKFNNLLSRYVIVSGLGTSLAVLLAWALPNAMYVFVFGETFNGLKETFLLLAPAVIFLGFSAPIGHFLHAQNRFKELVLSYGVALVILVLTWRGVEGFVPYLLTADSGAIPGTFLSIVAYVWKFISLNLAFLVLLVLNYLQVKHVLKLKANAFILWRFARRFFAK
jgi:O-antigen/teichoic acid export membrane protein